VAGDIQGSSPREPCVPQGSEARQATPRRFHSGKERSGSFRDGRREVSRSLRRRRDWQSVIRTAVTVLLRAQPTAAETALSKRGLYSTSRVLTVHSSAPRSQCCATSHPPVRGSESRRVCVQKGSVAAPRRIMIRQRAASAAILAGKLPTPAPWQITIPILQPAWAVSALPLSSRLAPTVETCRLVCESFGDFSRRLPPG
jgi:hypothetical protein